MLSKYTKKLLQQPPTLTPEDLGKALESIINNEETELLRGSFLTALRTTGLDHQPEYIAVAVETVLKFSNVINIAELNEEKECYVDIVGTGGDGQNTFNVSTSSAIVASGIPGIHVCKHGGKASTSNSGAGDLISKLGVDVSKVNATTVPQLLQDNDFAFLLAPYFHDGMKNVAHLRKNIEIPTIFNVLGPLLNPVPKVRKRILGVFKEGLGQVYAEAVKQLHDGSEAFVVWGECGLDEISPIGHSKVWWLKADGSIQQLRISPADFGLQEHPLEDVRSGSPEENAEMLKRVLNGEFERGHPIYDYILLNTGALAVVSGAAKDFKQGVELAETSIKSGAALTSLNKFIASVGKL